MIHGITPLVKRPETAQTGVKAGLAHFLAGAVGGAVTAMAIWLAFSPLRFASVSPWTAVVLWSVASVVAALRDLGWLRVAGLNVLVPQRWYATYGPVAAYRRYGLVLGSGVLTHVPSAAAPLALVLAGLQGSWVLAGTIGALVGFGRTVVPLVAAYWSAVGVVANWAIGAGGRARRGVSMVTVGLLAVGGLATL